jgi:peptide subunit release factor 1 (eRF1)
VFIGFPVLIAAGLAFFVVMLLLIIRINREGDKVIAHCPTCGTLMRREECASLEYHVCDNCKMYARGRDWS